MITIPSGELVGLLSDVIPFADGDKDALLLASVRLWWDGSMLHAEATDRVLYGHASWSPDDAPSSNKPEQESLFDRWGGTDDPWEFLLDLADAKDLVKNFKLGPKEWSVLLEVTYRFDRLSVRRRGDDEHSALLQDIDVHSMNGEFPDVADMLDKARELRGGRAEVAAIAFEPRRLGAFEKVRQRSPVRFTFHGPRGYAEVTIGNRFVGAIQPSRMPEEPASKPAPEPQDADLDDLEGMGDMGDMGELVEVA